MRKTERVTDTHIYFWSGWLSQWFRSRFSFEDDIFGECNMGCAEQYMMFQKAKLFGDMESAKKILNTTEGRACKDFGRNVKNFKENVWKSKRYHIVYTGNYYKFKNDLYLQKMLIETDDKILVEGSPYDKIWGVGLHFQDDLILDEKNWKGENLLGQAIMDVRADLKNKGGL